MRRPGVDRVPFLTRLEHALPVISLLIAGLSLAATIVQTLNYRSSIETIQRNVLRTENLKTCRDIIEMFFIFRLRAEEANARASVGALDAAGRDKERREMKSLVYRFGALGTHLANFSPDHARERYAALSWQLNDLAERATALTPGEFETTFAEADKSFAGLNEDCVQSTHIGR